MACASDAECDDGDPCTTDRCTAEGCDAVPVTGYDAVRCVFEGEASITAPCAGAAPRALMKRIDRARSAFERANRTGHATMIRQALVMLDRADQLRYKGAARGTIAPECSTAVTRLVRRVQGGADRWRNAR